MPRHATAAAWCLTLVAWGACSLAASAEPEQPIAIIANNANATTELSLSALARIYRGEQEKWPDGQRIVVLNLPAESDLRRRFYRAVLRAEPTKKFFKPGSPIPFTAMQVDSPDAVRRFVARIPNAVGYVAASEANESVQALTIEGKRPHEAGYVLVNGR